jgi:HAD superfamily hydrolase (TIGR01509 family)
MDGPEFFRQFCAANGYYGAFAEFEPCFGRIFSPLQPMIDFHRELRAQGWPTWIFSNTNGIAVKYIAEDFPFFRQFDGYIYSYEIGSMKPAPAMYDDLEKRSGFRGDEIIYLDDRPENVVAGADRGWRGIVHHDPATTIPMVRSWLGR